jgi:acetolactate synthase I/III small subunit
MQEVEMRDELVMVVARNRIRVLAEITTVMAHRRVDLAGMVVSCSQESDTLSAVFTVRPTSPHDIDMLHKRLNRVVDVIKVVALTEDVAHQREGVLIKVAANTNQRVTLLDIVRAFNAELVEVSPTTMTFALQSTPAQIRSLQEMLRCHRVLEMVTIGSSGIPRGAQTVHQHRSRREVFA